MASYTYYVDVTGPLFVGIREVVGAVVSTTVSYDYNGYGDCALPGFGWCLAQDDATDSFSACGVSDCDHCSAPGRYVIDVDVSPLSGYAGYSFDIIAINQYVPLTSAVQTTIGVLKHYYSYSAASSQSLVFHLNIQTGPAIELYVFEGCESESTDFSESVTCAFGDCYVYVPSKAKRSDATTYYLVLTSATYGGPDFLPRNIATNSNKATSYSLAVTSGTQNCVAASTLGNLEFCGSVFKNVSSSSVWAFADAASKDSEAECLYLSISSSIQCPQATNDCLEWLHTLSCLITFPQCDSNGFQLGVCRDVCEVVDNYCGVDWEAQLTNFFSGFNDFTAYDCASAFYVDSTPATCYPLPTPPPPPSSVDDYKPVSAGPAVLDPFDVPVFSDVTIYLTTGEFNSYSNIFTSGATASDSTITASELTSLFSSGVVFGSASTLSCMGVFALVFLVLML